LIFAIGLSVHVGFCAGTPPRSGLVQNQLKRISDMKISKQLIRQTFLYGVIGGCSALSDILLFALLYGKMTLNEFVANGISVHAGIALSFTLNSRYNFKKTDKVLFRASAFYLTGLFGLVLSESLLFIGNVWNIPVMVAKILSVFIVAGVQFSINKLVAFGR
jgi:putative flippase GtrA